MATSKDIPITRPASGSFSRLSSSARPHSNSISLSAANSHHRVNRRKSVNASTSSTAHAALAAALKGHGEIGPLPAATSHRRSTSSRKNTESHSTSARPSMHSYFQGPPGTHPAHGIEQEAVEDNSQDESSSKDFSKQRNRRASEGSPLVKGDHKKAGGDLKCETCGKGYKHSSCLTKHLWEHDPAWAITSKFLISKHQQVQLLEAASVLCNMTTEMEDGLEHEHAHERDILDGLDMDMSQVDPSEASSASPGYSGFSDLHDDLSSVETTPPPPSERTFAGLDMKRVSTSSNGFSRSYRSRASSSFAESTASPGLFPQRLSGVDFRPGTSHTDDGGLAKATAGLSFYHGTPGMRPTLDAEIPPVPPLPQQYQSYTSKPSGTILTAVHDPFALHPPTLSHRLSDERTYREDRDDRDERNHERSSSTHAEEGIFKMEE